MAFQLVLARLFEPFYFVMKSPCFGDDHFVKLCAHKQVNSLLMDRAQFLLDNHFSCTPCGYEDSSMNQNLWPSVRLFFASSGSSPSCLEWIFVLVCGAKELLHPYNRIRRSNQNGAQGGFWWESVMEKREDRRERERVIEEGFADFSISGVSAVAEGTAC